jgi:ParB family chromosome partitioning protein
MLTEKTVRASDKRSVFVGLGAYEAAGGIVLCDLFEQDGGGWLEDVALLDGLAAAKLKAEAEKIAAEGWKWVEVATEFPYGSKPKDGGGDQTRKRAERFFVNGFRG